MFERLTERSDAFDCIAIINPRDPEGLYELGDLDTDEDADLINAVADRLAAYEDSGLSPEQVQELAKAKEEGKLAILPLKVGSTIYRLEAPQYSWEIVSATMYLDGTIFTDDSDNIIKETDIGKTVFLTREEAERALREG